MPACETWIRQKIKVADIVADVRCNSETAMRFVRSYFAGFLAEEGEEGLFAIEISFAEKGLLPFPERTEVVEESGRAYFIVKDLFGALDKKSKTASVMVVNDKRLIPTFIRSVYLALMHEHGAVLLHSSSYIENSRAHLFLGRSGAGKSTVARGNLGRRGVTVIDEDMNLVRRVRGKFMLYSHPFTRGNTPKGYLRSEISRPAEIADVNVLFKAERNSIRAAHPADAISALLYCTYTTSNNAPRCAALLDLYNDFASKYPVNEFRFAKCRPYLGGNYGGRQ